MLAPPAVINDFAAANQLTAVRSPVVRVGTWVAVRTGAPVPDIANRDTVKQFVLAADSLVINLSSPCIDWPVLGRAFKEDRRAHPD